MGITNTQMQPKLIILQKTRPSGQILMVMAMETIKVQKQLKLMLFQRTHLSGKILMMMDMGIIQMIAIPNSENQL